MSAIQISILYILLLLLLSLPSCDRNKQSGKSSKGQDSLQTVDFDLEDIIQRDTLIAIVNNTSTGYFIYKGQPMGYQYDLVDKLAKHLDVKLKIKVITDIEESFNMLNTGEADIIAHRLAITRERRQKVSFTQSHYMVRQVLVQKKPENWRQMKLHEIENELIRNPIELIGKQVHVRKSSSYLSRLQNLSAEIGGEIKIIEEAGTVSTETLIKQVAQNKIKYTVADDDIAKVNATYYPVLDIQTELSMAQQIAWAVRKNAPNLLAEINTWLSELKSEPYFNVLYAKYFKKEKDILQRTTSNFNSVTSDQISPYDEYIKDAANQIGWDWKLIAAQIQVESNFDPNTTSWMGAIGLMQVVPETADMFGHFNLYKPQENIQAGSEYLKWLQDFWKSRVNDEKERKRFILASYNVGQGHVVDAMKLTEKYGRNPQQWNGNVEYYLRQKAKPKYYTDEVVEMGYCRGEEPVNYVIDVLQIHQRYSQLIKDSVKNTAI